MRRKIMPVCCGLWITSRDRLRADGEVSDFSECETLRGPRAASLAGPGNVSGLEEFFQRFSAESRDHFRIGYAFDASEFLEAEEARAVAHERSEERRVGKEWREREEPDDQEIKNEKE